MNTLKKIEKMCYTELEDIANRNTMNAANLDAIDKLTQSIKSIDIICSMGGEGNADEVKDDDKAEKTEALLKQFAEQLKSL